MAAFDRWAESGSSARGIDAVDRVAYGLSQAANHSLLWHGINAADSLGALLRGDRTRAAQALRRSTVLGFEQALVNGPVKSGILRERPVPLAEHPHRLRSPSTPPAFRVAMPPPAPAQRSSVRQTRATGEPGGPSPDWWDGARSATGLHHPSDVLGLAHRHRPCPAAQRIWP
ncbi:MAG: hypothetical protein R2789_02650 [Microthrixaceae bacterium]